MSPLLWYFAASEKTTEVASAGNCANHLPTSPLAGTTYSLACSPQDHNATAVIPSKPRRRPECKYLIAAKLLINADPLPRRAANYLVRHAVPGPDPHPKTAHAAVVLAGAGGCRWTGDLRAAVGAPRDALHSQTVEHAHRRGLCPDP